jgi:hypothetical protein
MRSHSPVGQSIINAFKEFGATVLKEAINHPVANVLIATFKGLVETK